MSSVRPSVRLSVTLVDQDRIDWKSWKLIARTISPTPLLFVAQRPSTYSQLAGEHGQILGRLEVGCGKVVLEHESDNISETRKNRGKVTMESLLYRNSPTVFLTVPSRPPTASSSPRLGVRNPHPKLQ